MSSPLRRTRQPVSDDRLMPNTSPEKVALPEDKLKLLKILVVELQQQLESVSAAQKPDVSQGLDFYDEVSRFEIDLIKRALMLNGGHQGRAALLLNLKPKTLNAKIKHYQIQPAGPAGSLLRYSRHDNR